jgi:hypothetical protein
MTHGGPSRASDRVVTGFVPGDHSTVRYHRRDSDSPLADACLDRQRLIGAGRLVSRAES